MTTKRHGPIGNRRAGRPKGLHFIEGPVAVDEVQHAASVRIPHAARSLTFEVPLPFKALSKNTIADHRRKAPYVKQYRAIVQYAAMEAMAVQGWIEPSAAVIHLTYGTLRPKRDSRDDLLEKQGEALSWPYRPLDSWNAISAFHPGFDGLTDAGVWPDDSFRWASLGSCHIDPSLRPAVYISITERRFG